MIDKLARLEPVVDELCATVRLVDPHLGLHRGEFLAHNEPPENGLDRPLLRHLQEKVGKYRMRV